MPGSGASSRMSWARNSRITRRLTVFLRIPAASRAYIRSWTSGHRPVRRVTLWKSSQASTIRRPFLHRITAHLLQEACRSGTGNEPDRPLSASEWAGTLAAHRLPSVRLAALSKARMAARVPSGSDAHPSIRACRSAGMVGSAPRSVPRSPEICRFIGRFDRGTRVRFPPPPVLRCSRPCRTMSSGVRLPHRRRTP